MKKAIAISLAFLMLAISTKDLAIYMVFKANQDYLSDTLCINRFAPEELCYATCIFEATLQDSQKQSQEPGALLDQNQKLIFDFDQLPKQEVFSIVEQNIPPTQLLSLFSQTFLTDIFQPPEV